MSPHPAHDFTRGLYGWITHTDFASTDPAATRTWCETVHVEDTQSAFDAAVAAGAEPVRPPTRIMEGVCVAMVRAPGGILIGRSGPTD